MLNGIDMKIGILTLPFNNNYGGYLQAYALMTVLKRMGHQPTLIMRRHNKPKISARCKIKLFVTGLLKTILTLKKHQIIYDVEYGFNKKGRDMHKFVNEFMQPQTPYLYDTVSLKKYCEGKFDAYIVGSDQVWRAIYVPDIKNFYLDFTKGWDVIRIAYAASFGTDHPEYTDKQVLQCGKLLKYFDAVSIREKSGNKVFESFGWGNLNPNVVLDPTMLLNANDYSKVLPSDPSESLGKVFYYVLDLNPTLKNLLEDTSSLLEKELYGISNIQHVGEVLPSIEEWLINIRDSNFVVTDSFHGMVFSIIFHKPFIVCVNFDRGVERFISLLDELGLSDRIYNSDCNLQILMANDINWIDVEKRISLLREKSINFLKQQLR